MPALDLAQNHPRRNVRLDTLVRLRWLAIIGQTTAVLVVYFGLDFDAADLGLPRGDRAVGLAQRGAAPALSHDAAAGARPRRLAARLRHRRTGGAAVPDRRPAEPVRLSVPGAGAAVGDRAAAALHADARRLRHRLRDRAGVRALSAAVGQRGPAAAAADLHDSASGSRSCSPSDSSASTPGRSPRNPASSPTRSPPPNWCWRASSISRSSTGLPPPPRTSSARRSPPFR